MEYTYEFDEAMVDDRQDGEVQEKEWEGASQ